MDGTEQWTAPHLKDQRRTESESCSTGVNLAPFEINDSRSLFRKIGSVAEGYPISEGDHGSRSTWFLGDGRRTRRNST